MKILVLVVAAVVFLCPRAEAEQAWKFEPAWWCRGEHCQTIYAGVFRWAPKLALRRERIDTPDGDFLDLDWLDGNTNSPLVVILHGLGSSSKTPSVQILLDEIRKLDWRAVAMNARGASGEPNRLRVTNHAGRSDDLDWVVKQILKNEKPEQIYLVGFSLGGNIILKWLGEQGAAVPPQVKRAVAISVPYDLWKTTEFLDQGFNREVYTRALLDKLKSQILAKEKLFPDIINWEKAKRAKTFKVYDHEVTAPLNGFKDEVDYWARSSSAAYLDKIRVPALLIHAANDPFLPAEFLPYEQIRKSGNLTLLLTQDGGHMGFISGHYPWTEKRWLEKTILSFLSS